MINIICFVFHMFVRHCAEPAGQFVPRGSELREAQADACVGVGQVASGALHRPVRDGGPGRVGGALLADESGDPAAEARQARLDAARLPAAAHASRGARGARAAGMSL